MEEPEMNYTKTLTEFEHHLREEEKSKATIEKYLRDVRYFLTFAKEREITKSLTSNFVFVALFVR